MREISVNIKSEITVKKIVLNVSDENMQTVMTVLTNLKAGLIDSIDAEGLKASRKTSYVPKDGRIVDENEKPSGKYVSASAYKSRLKK